MTAAQRTIDRDLINFIIAYTEEHGFPPSRRECAAHLGNKSAQTVQHRMERLIGEGVIERVPGVPRGIRINRDRITQLGGQ